MIIIFRKFLGTDCGSLLTLKKEAEIVTVRAYKNINIHTFLFLRRDLID